MSGRLLGVDYGKKRIGLAVSDALGISARELAVLPSRGASQDFAAICDVALRERAVALVVGVPVNPNAPPGIVTQADIVRDWIARLRKATHLPVHEISEYLTSEEARTMARMLQRRAHEPIDDLAACVILQSFLDARSR
ncbi:MAG: Holliday junction resolvase RuvX [Chloroflexi bacterium]|nr:Holliday junction resolvase RuvX [Chloroflexota bacterium]MCY4248324.1 Holliday junction resolvase RuvX [Chloroflexota bacterium]